MFKKYILLKLVLSIIFISFIANCNNKKDSILGTVTPGAGTGTDNTGNTADTTKTFHPQGWASKTLHGAASLNGFTACKKCHGDDYKGGTSKVGCYKCHNGAGIDHPDTSWIVLNHKTKALGNIIICKKCHGDDYKGGGAGIACNKCHLEKETKVHMLGWDSVNADHGAYTDTTNSVKCANVYCHGSDLKGVNGSGPSCDKCHGWPYAHKLSHGNYVRANGTTNCASAVCHGSDFKGVVGSGPSCSSCHMENETKVHMLDWYGTTTINLAHRAYAQNNGFATCFRTKCHSKHSGSSTDSGPGCNTCHNNITTAPSGCTCH